MQHVLYPPQLAVPHKLGRDKSHQVKETNLLYNDSVLYLQEMNSAGKYDLVILYVEERTVTNVCIFREMVIICAQPKYPSTIISIA